MTRSGSPAGEVTDPASSPAARRQNYWRRDIIEAVNDTTERDRWHFDDRWYEVTMASVVSHLDRDGMALELDDIGPSPGRGVVLEVFYDDDTGQMTFTSHTTEPLPFLLIEAFIAEARRRLPPI